jgi:hypothetical protein
MAKPKRDYTISVLDVANTIHVHIHLNDLDSELMVKILKVEGVVRCFAFSHSALLIIRFSPNYDNEELLAELKTLLKVHFAPNNPVPDVFADEFNETL